MGRQTGRSVVQSVEPARSRVGLWWRRQRLRTGPVVRLCRHERELLYLADRKGAGGGGIAIVGTNSTHSGLQNAYPRRSLGFSTAMRYGRTVNVAELHRNGDRVALGTDWS